MTDKKLVKKCEDAAKRIRKQILDMTYSTGNTGAHLGGSLSIVDLLAALYLGVLNYDNKDPNYCDRDRVILSKGHAALALYPTLAEAGIIDFSELDSFKKDGSRLGGHPSLNGLPGIEFASGSLGQGLSLGVGVCLGLKRKNNQTSKVYVFLGDGECDEGSVWEAAMSASHFGLQQLIAVIDSNSVQYDGYTKDVMNLESQKEKWESFGWETAVINGHDIHQILEAYRKVHEKPLAIIANTVKGKGISFMENNYRYHNASLSKELYERAVNELEEIQ